MTEGAEAVALPQSLYRHLSALAWCLGRDPVQSFEAADRAAAELTGRAYATILRLEANHLSRRLFSSVPDVYVVGATKTLSPSPWREQVVGRAEAFIAATPAEIAEHFPDPEVVASLGGRCLANIPISDQTGEPLGLLNVAGSAPFSGTQLQILQLLAQLLGPAVLAAHCA